ncbi:cytochrome P450 2D14-like, partial [Elysia marginata]
AGDIFSLYFGSRLVVVLNSYKMVKEGLVTNANALSDRPPWKHLEGSTNGLFFSNGHLWKEQRTMSISILRSFGMGKGSLSTKIKEEVSSYLEALAALRGKPTDVFLLTRTSISNIICSIIVGKRYEYDDPFFAAFMESFDKMAQASETAAPVMFWPWLRHIPGNFMKSKTLNRCVHEMLEEFCIPHLCIAEVTLQGYTIPAGTTVLPNLDIVMMDENIWEKPLEFRPERFIDDKGNLIKHEAFMPFSVGRRMCLGEALASMELFLFVSSLVQRFQLQPTTPSRPPKVDAIDGIVSAPKSFHVRFFERASLHA